jgi:hypothetical protein
MGFRWSRWGVMEEGGGLLDQPIGLVDKVTSLTVVYEAWRGFTTAGNRLVDWAENNRGHMKVVTTVQRLRQEMETD